MSILIKGVGRVLPKEYLYFSGDGIRNTFRTQYKGGHGGIGRAVAL